MIAIVLGVLVGLVVGWNFLPQPKFAKSAVDFVVNYVKSKFNWS